MVRALTRVAVFGDVHGNLPALEEFVASTRSEVDSYVCLGDIVGYGPWSNECVDLTLSLPGVLAVQGNHERLYLGWDRVEDESALVQSFVLASRRGFARHDLIAGLPRELSIDDVTFTHTIGRLRVYPDTEMDVEGKWVLGHSHHQFRTVTPSGWVVNPGSLGQNRAYIDSMQYAIWDRGSDVFEFFDVPSDIDVVIHEMESAHYPEECVRYYRDKPRKYAP
jgi:predicted phosphodiesterase